MKTRRIKTLLKILLKSKDLFMLSPYGLCGLSYELSKSAITYNEYEKIMKYIITECELQNLPHYHLCSGNGIFYFPVGTWDPREEWLKQEIAKHK